MKVDDRAKLLRGMRASASPKVSDGMWSLAGSVLSAFDRAAVARRLNLAWLVRAQGRTRRWRPGRPARSAKDRPAGRR